jgi:hypothetical protein
MFELEIRPSPPPAPIARVVRCNRGRLNRPASRRALLPVTVGQGLRQF